TGEATISPAQLSVAVKSIASGNSVIHCAVISAGAAGATGAVVSATVMVCDTDDVLLQASVKVQVRVTMTLQGSESSVVSTGEATISPAQLSVAVKSIASGNSVI